MWAIWTAADDGSGGETQIIERFGGNEYTPDFSPDGSTIAWTHCFSPSCPGSEIWLADADGTNRRALTDNGVVDFSPAWKPDGSAIAFASRRSGGSSGPPQIWRIDADGTGQTQLTNVVYNHSPSWGYVRTSIEVTIDIKPGSFPNSINLGSGGATPVPILGSAKLNVNDIDPDTLTLGTAGIKTVGKTDRLLCSVDDVSGDFADGPEGAPDGFDDLVCHFLTMEIVSEEGDTEASIAGALYNATPIGGSDSVNIVP